MRHTKAAEGDGVKEQGRNQETLTAIPQAARGAAPVCTSTLLSLVSVSSDSPAHSNTHTEDSSALLALAEQQEGGIRWLGQADGKRRTGEGADK